MILRNYLIRESLISIGAVLIVFIFIYGSARFAHYLADAAAGKLPGHLIASMLMLEQLAFSPLTLPLCFSVGLILAIGRLQQDRELMVMAGAGIATHTQAIAPQTSIAPTLAALAGAPMPMQTQGGPIFDALMPNAQLPLVAATRLFFGDTQKKCFFVMSAVAPS